MDQSKSNNNPTAQEFKPPTRTFSVEFFVGLFTLAGVLAIAYLSIGLGGLQINNSKKYEVFAEFDNVAGLKKGAPVEIAGVPIGEVVRIDFNDPIAKVTMRIDKKVGIRDDDIAAIRTKGIIGDRYVKISRGASETFIQEGCRIQDTESVVDFEDIVGKLIHRLGGDEK